MLRELSPSSPASSRPLAPAPPRQPPEDTDDQLLDPASGQVSPPKDCGSVGYRKGRDTNRRAARIVHFTWRLVRCQFRGSAGRHFFTTGPQNLKTEEHTSELQSLR